MNKAQAACEDQGGDVAVCHTPPRRWTPDDPYGSGPGSNPCDFDCDASDQGNDNHWNPDRIRLSECNRDVDVNFGICISAVGTFLGAGVAICAQLGPTPWGAACGVYVALHGGVTAAFCYRMEADGHHDCRVRYG